MTTTTVRRAKQLLITALAVLAIAGGMGLPSPAAAATAQDVYVGQQYAGWISCGATRAWTGSTYRYNVKCTMTDSRADGKGIYASVQNASTGSWILWASNCTNTAGAGTTTQCNAVVYSSGNPWINVRWGFTNNGSYYQTGNRVLSLV